MHPTTYRRDSWSRSCRPRPAHRRSLRCQRLRFSPTSWAKLLFLRDHGPTEVGAFAIAPADDLLYVEDLELVRQVCTTVSVVFDDASVAEFFDDQVDAGRQPAQFARIWVHTHPGRSARPSPVDEETFQRVFGRCDWAVMFILAREGATYCRLRFGAGPGGSFEIPTKVDYAGDFRGSDCTAWAREYEDAVTEAKFREPVETLCGLSPRNISAPHFDLFDDFSLPGNSSRPIGRLQEDFFDAEPL
jgi:proteasome lid subunit RPN8/RPN11